MTVCSDRQIDGEDFVNFCGLLRKHELYTNVLMANLSLVTDFSFDSYVYLGMFIFIQLILVHIQTDSVYLIKTEIAKTSLD